MEIMETATSAGTTDITAGAARGRLARRLAAGAGALAAVLGGAAALGATPAHAATNPSAAGLYSLTNVGTGGVAGVATGDGNVSPSTSSENQKWRFAEVDPSSPLWVTAQVSDSLGAAGASVPTHAYLIESEPDSAGITTCLEPMSATPGAPTVVGGCFTSLVNELWYQVVVNGKTQLVNGSAATIAATPAGDRRVLHNARRRHHRHPPLQHRQPDRAVQLRHPGRSGPGAHRQQQRPARRRAAPGRHVRVRPGLERAVDGLRGGRTGDRDVHPSAVGQRFLRLPQRMDPVDVQPGAGQWGWTPRSSS